MNHPFLSIVIPAHNEETRLPQALREVYAFLDRQPFSSEVLVVENGSTDRTLETARELARRFPNLTVLHEDLPGKGRATRLGMLAARGEYRFLADADFSMPVTEIPRFLLPQCQADIAIASRESAGAVRYNEPAFRHLTGRIFNLLIRSLVLPSLQDTQCGFKCFKAAVADDIFRVQTLDGWSFDVELLVVARRHGYTISEIGIPWTYTPGSKVKVVRDSWRMFRDLLVIRRNARQGKYDAH